MSNSAQLEKEAEQTRSELARSLDELRERLTPGQLLDEALDYAKASTGGEFFRNLSRQMTANPLPVVLIGTGISWLALAKGNSGAAGTPAMTRFKDAAGDMQSRASATTRAASEHLGEWASQAGDNAAEAAQHASDTAASLSETATDEMAAQARSKLADTGSALSEGAASAYGSMKSGVNSAANIAADAYGRATDTANRTGLAMAQSASSLSGVVSDAMAFCKDRPLVLAGLGLALGAVLGAVIPPSDAEDRLMGETSDRIKDQARGTAEEQIDKVKTAVEQRMDEGKTQVEGLAQSADEPTTMSLVPEDEPQHEDATAKLPLD